MKYIILVISSLLLTTCNHIEEGEVVKKNTQTEVLDIDLDANRTVYMSDIFQDIRYIKLDTKEDHLIGSIQKIVIRDSTIFIFENSMPSIFMYDLSGKYINQVVIPQGRGPKEMITTKDFVVNKEKKELVVLGHTKINTYSYDGSFVESQNLKIMPDKIAQLPDDNYALFMNNEMYTSMEIMDNPYNLLYLNEDEIVKRFLPIDKYKADLGFTVPNNFPKYRDHILLYFHPSYTIYELNSSHISARYTLDFGENAVPPSLYKERESLTAGHKFMKKTLEGEYASYLANFIETDQLIYFSIFWDRPKSYPVFYSKNTNQALIADKLVNDIDGGLSPYFITSYNNELVAHIQPNDLLEKVSELKKKDKDQLNEQQNRLIRFADNLKTFDNPIIMLGEVKSDFN